MTDEINSYLGKQAISHPLDEALTLIRNCTELSSSQIHFIKAYSDEIVENFEIESEFFDSIQRCILMILIANRAHKSIPMRTKNSTKANHRQSVTDGMTHITNLAIATFRNFSKTINEFVEGENDLQVSELEVLAFYETATNEQLSEELAEWIQSSEALNPVRCRFGYETDRHFTVRVLDIPTPEEMERGIKDDDLDPEDKQRLYNNFEKFSKLFNTAGTQAWCSEINGEVTLFMYSRQAKVLLNPECADPVEYETYINTISHEFYHTQSDILRELNGTVIGVGLEEFAAELDLNSSTYLDIKLHFLVVEQLGLGSVVDVLEQFDYNHPYTFEHVLLHLISEVGLERCLDHLLATPEDSIPQAIREVYSEMGGLTGLQSDILKQLDNTPGIDVDSRFAEIAKKIPNPIGFCNSPEINELPFTKRIAKTIGQKDNKSQSFRR